MSDYEIQRVSLDELNKVIALYAPRGLFLAKGNNLWIAVDNSTGDAWTEGFQSRQQAVRWLRGEFEVSDC